MELGTKLHKAWWVLRSSLALYFILSGIDQFIYLMCDWEVYMHPFVKAHLPINVSTFFMLHGTCNIILGSLYLTRWVKEAGYVGVFWVGSIIINLLFCGTYVDIALRDVVIAAGSLAVSYIAEFLNNK